MKKLMTMIAAVATAFGLYAADSSYYSTSFEPGYDSGCTTEPLAFNLETAGWTAGTTTETSLDLGTYGAGEGYAYPNEGKGKRRDELFLGNDTNTKYLKLETGNSSVGKTISEGAVFIDQTVKFTGFEEVPAADAIDGQIAIWASAIEADDTADPAIVGETNLYARVGTGSGYADVKIDIPFNPDNWYRLTIKSLGNVIDSAKGDEIQAGFLVYINGNLATIAAADQSYSTIADHFETNAGRYYSKGQLFTGMGATAAFTTVAFQGIGSIDDFVTSVEAPDFAAEVEFTVAAITGATIDKVVAMDGEKEVVLTAPYAVMPGTTVKVYFTAAGGYRLDADIASIVINEAGQIDVSGQITVVEGYATLNGAIKGEAELAAMMAGLKANDTVAFLKNGDVTNDVADVLYSFTKNTQIEVAEGGAWTLSIMNVAAEEPGTFVAKAAIANDITVAYESGDEFDIYANTIPAGITVDASDENGSVLLFADPITVAGTLKVNSTATFAGAITLDGAGSVWSKTKLAGSIFTNEKVAEAGEAQSGYTYTIKAEPTTGFRVILAGDTEGEVYQTLAEAFGAAQAGSTIKLLANGTATAKVDVTKNITLDLNGKTLARDNNAATLFVIKDATLTINGATEGSALVGRLNVGDSVYNGGVRTAHWDGALVINGGTYSVGDGQTVIHVNGDCLNAAVTINNATLTSPTDNGVQFNGKGTFAINNSTINGATAVYMKAGTLTIDKDSKINATATTWTAPVANHNGSNPTGDAIVMDSITGYQGAISLTVADGAQVTKVAEDAATIRETITDATVSTTVKIDAPTIGGIALTEAFLEKVANGSAQLPGYVAAIGTVPYQTLAAAFEAAANGDTVEMLADVSLAANEKIVIMNKAVTLAGAFTVTAAGRAFNVQQGGTLTISKETTVIGTGKPATIFLWPYDFDSRALTDADAAHYGKAKLVVNGTVKYTTTGNEGAIASNGNDSIAESEGVDVIINGTVINECDSALYLPGKGTCTVNDGAYIEGTYAGIQMKAVTLTVNGGTIKATGEDQTPTALWANGAKPSGCAIQMEGNTAYAGGINLTVNGGTIESVNAKAIYAYGAQEKFGTISIVGGIIKGNTGVFLLDQGMNKAIVPGSSKAQFNKDVTDFCEEGYETVKLESAEFYTVRAKQTDPIPSLPDNPTADVVNAKVDEAKFADSTVKTMIGGDSTKYNAFKTWAGTVSGGEAAVVESAHAADSYLLGQTTLLANAPVSEIKTIAKTSDTALTLTFEIKDGANAVAVADSAKAYVASIVQCNEKVDFGNGTKIDATVTVTINGTTLTAAVTLPANKPAAFMKVAK